MVRSASEVAHQMLVNSDGIGSSSAAVHYGLSEPVWKKLWKVKVKVFTWRVIHDILPTKQRLMYVDV